MSARCSRASSIGEAGPCPVISGRNLVTSALTYAFNQEKELLRVLDNGGCPGQHAVRALAPKSRRRQKAWLFYGSAVHAQAAAAIFSIVASCRLHSLDPEQYIEEVMRLLPYWPDSRYLELAPNNWACTRAKLLPAELDAPFGSFSRPRGVSTARSARTSRCVPKRWRPWIAYVEFPEAQTLILSRRERRREGPAIRASDRARASSTARGASI